jgi:hypothetical protein
MRGYPLKAIASLAIAALIGYLHDRHVWPLNSIFNEFCTLIVIIAFVAILQWRENNT